jgi:UDP-N-acetylglucosamine 2-epimerase (non-hydrolysing)
VIVIIYGTTGELIKLISLIKEMPEDQQIRVNTNQQPKQLEQLMDDAKLPEPHYTLTNGRGGKDLEKKSDILLWGLKLSGQTIKDFRSIKRQLKATPGKHAVMVHGDTVTTVYGAVLAKFLGLPIVHIEAGMRSHDWRNPFPEEIDRRIVGKLARYHFSPGDTPTSDLKREKAKGKIIDTQRNTVLDSLRYAQKAPVSGKGFGSLNPKKSYVVISIHRNELMANPKALKELLESIRDHSERDNLQMVFLDHPITKERISALGYDDLLKGKNIIRLPKLSYYRFIQLAAGAKYAITDSGGLQEESSFLGIPCLIHRMATERIEGLGKTAELSLYDKVKVEAFMSNPDKYIGSKEGDKIQPTKIILDELLVAGFITE